MEERTQRRGKCRGFCRGAGLRKSLADLVLIRVEMRESPGKDNPRARAAGESLLLRVSDSYAEAALRVDQASAQTSRH